MLLRLLVLSFILSLPLVGYSTAHPLCQDLIDYENDAVYGGSVVQICDNQPMGPEVGYEHRPSVLIKVSSPGFCNLPEMKWEAQSLAIQECRSAASRITPWSITCLDHVYGESGGSVSALFRCGEL